MNRVCAHIVSLVCFLAATALMPTTDAKASGGTNSVHFIGQIMYGSPPPVNTWIPAAGATFSIVVYWDTPSGSFDNALLDGTVDSNGDFDVVAPAGSLPTDGINCQAWIADISFGNGTHYSFYNGQNGDTYFIAPCWDPSDSYDLLPAYAYVPFP